MKIYSKYLIFRFLFGLFILLLGLRLLTELDQNKELVIKSVTLFEEKVLKSPDIETYFNQYLHFLSIPSNLNIEYFKASAGDLVFTEAILLIIGGFFCMFSYSICKVFIITAFILDFIFIHNINFFSESKSRGAVLKLLGILGGTFYIV